MGGVTRVVVDPKTGEKISSNLDLGGTIRNCAGGTSPWGWLSCEESDDTGHGFVFLTKTDAESIQPPQRIDAYGRCYHEAVAIDPDTYVAYLTEDRDDSCLYRMVPNSMDTPFEGKLQALKVVDEDKADLGTGRLVGDRWKVEWVDLEDPSSPDDTLRYDGQRSVRQSSVAAKASRTTMVLFTSVLPVAASSRVAKSSSLRLQPKSWSSSRSPMTLISGYARQHLRGTLG